MDKLRIEQIATKRGYVVSEDGIMYNPKGEEIGHKNDNGYIKTNIRPNKGEHHSVLAHRLQAFQKYGQALYLKGIVTRHYDGNKLNNSWDNILIGTHQQNMLDIPEQIRIKKSKLSWKNTREYKREDVRLFYNNCKSYKKTKEKFNISSSGTLHYILKGRKK